MAMIAVESADGTRYLVREDGVYVEESECEFVWAGEFVCTPMASVEALEVTDEELDEVPMFDVWHLVGVPYGDEGEELDDDE